MTVALLDQSDALQQEGFGFDTELDLFVWCLCVLNIHVVILSTQGPISQTKDICINLTGTPKLFL